VLVGQATAATAPSGSALAFGGSRRLGPRFHFPPDSVAIIAS